VTVDGRFHHITAAGLAPLPVQRPIPIWIGAFAPAALRRVGRLADGWFPMARPGGGLNEALEAVAEGAREVGRDPSTIAFEGRVDYNAGGPERVAEHAARWSEAGASHVSVNTMRAWLEGVDAHIAALTTVAALVL
jgi:alkanesulfonate monooxygenase SsuD/methylene tetrahydromethanopterin reductase-like flavin-dependent oxidoreductase (luciferase family)